MLIFLFLKKKTQSAMEFTGTRVFEVEEFKKNLCEKMDEISKQLTKRLCEDIGRIVDRGLAPIKREIKMIKEELRKRFSRRSSQWSRFNKRMKFQQACKKNRREEFPMRRATVLLMATICCSSGGQGSLVGGTQKRRSFTR